MGKYVEVEVCYLIDDTVYSKKFRGHSKASQLWDGGRAIIKIFNKKGQLIKLWHGTHVQYIETRYKRT